MRNVFQNNNIGNANCKKEGKIKMDDTHYGSIDFLRVIFCICVIIGHIYITFYMQTDDKEIFVMQNMSVDAFFMISGIFMAKSCHNILRKTEVGRGHALVLYTFQRIKKLYPLYMITSVIYIIWYLYIGTINLKEIPDFWPIIFFGEGINGLPNLSVMWYVSSLIWMGFFLSACLVFMEEKSVTAIFPILIFLTFSYMYAIYGNLSLNSLPLINNWFSAGNIKALCAIASGIEAYYIASYIKNNFLEINGRYVLCAEVFSVLGVIYCLFKRGLGKYNFLIYPCMFILLIILLLRKERVLRFHNKRIIKLLGSVTYATYLIHMMIIEIIKKLGIIKENDSRVYRVYFLICVCSFVLGYVFFLLDKEIQKILLKLK